MAINRNKYDGVHYQVVLMNMRDGSVQGHAAGCADLTRGKAKFAEPEQANDVWDVIVKEDAREAYNADFDEELDGWYDIDWLPCAKHIPDHAEEAEVAEEPTVETTIKVCGKWTRFYQNGVEVGRVHNDAADAVFAVIRG